MNNSTASDDLSIAIVGMSARLPGASSLPKFWDNLVDGKEAIVDLSDEELLAAGVPQKLLDDPAYVKRAVILEGMDRFDAGFFGINAKEASIMDPQHRLFLECGWHALEDAAQVPENFDGSIGVFAGCGYGSYMTYNLLRNQELLDSAGFFLLRHSGNDKDFLATRLSYELNLTGPSINIQTACSTSLVAVHTACQSLLNGECDMALAGGSTVEIPHQQGYLYKPGEIFSPDGHCRAFDAQAAGTVFGSGAGVVVLRRLEDAIADGDDIRAIIKGSAINNDGAQKAGYLAPSVDGQVRAIAEALDIAEIEPESVSYVEAHGTGTLVGDPIEVAALSQAYANPGPVQHCALGSLKTNIGHLDTAAGIAGLIKIVLSLQNKTLPASLHYNSSNDDIDFANSPFYVNATTKPWDTEAEAPRRAGISSLGVGGTNAHLILEEWTNTSTSAESREHQLFLISAKNPASLDANCDHLIETLSKPQSEERLADIAYTSQVGRMGFELRRAVVAANAEEASSRLDLMEATSAVAGTCTESEASLAFMFPGQGAQHLGMAQKLYDSEAVYRKEVDECCEHLKPKLGLDLRDLMFSADSEEAKKQLNNTAITQPALFVVEYALAQLWMHWGLRPNALIGHSIGEYVAATIAGVFHRNAALDLVCARGALMQSMPAGSMLAVMLSQDALEVELSTASDLEIAAINAPELCVVSGSRERIKEFSDLLSAKDIGNTLLRTSHAFHSRSMEPILNEFEALVRTAEPHRPQLAFVSNITGTWITDTQATDPRYWALHLRQPVCFSQGVRTLLEDPNRILLEVGPGNSLSRLATAQASYCDTHHAISCLPGAAEQVDDSERLLLAVGALWVAGLPIDWNLYHLGYQRQRMSLPGYGFSKQRHWIDPDPRADVQNIAVVPVEAELSAADWLTNISWQPREAAVAQTHEPSTLVLMTWAEDRALVQELNESAMRMGLTVEHAEITPDDDSKVAYESPFVGLNSQPVTLDSEEITAFLNAALAETEDACVIYLAPRSGQISPNAEFTRCFDLPLQISQALSEIDAQGLRVNFVGRANTSANGEFQPDLNQAMAVGPALVLGLEYPEITSRYVEVDEASPASALLGELVSGNGEYVQLRNENCYVREYTRAAETNTQNALPISDRGVYLITGGQNGVGFQSALALVEQGARKLVLVGRSFNVPEADWNLWLENHEGEDRASRVIRNVQQLRDMGAQVVLEQVDITRLQATQALIERCKDLGQIKGVIHAAATVDDQLLAYKEAYAAWDVIAPKLIGLNHLQQALHQEHLDFFVAYSSISSLVGVKGQVDYVAANAVLDSAAQAGYQVGGAKLVSINWSPWSQTGMAHRFFSNAKPHSAALGHPLLQDLLLSNADTDVYSLQLNTTDHWVLAEHKFAQGASVLPGTAYLEIAKAAFEPMAAYQAVTMRDVVFMTPIVCQPDAADLASSASVEVRVQLDATDEQGANFVIMSHADSEDQQTWYTNVKGTISKLSGSRPMAVDIASLQAGMSLLPKHTNEQTAFLTFGKRWTQSIQQAWINDTQSLIELRLADEFASDVDTYHSHPALLDLATAGVLQLVPGFEQGSDFYVPLGYTNLDFFERMPAHLYGHAIYREDLSELGDLAVFDIQVLSSQGEIVANISEFVLKRLAETLGMAETKPLPTTRFRAAEIPEPVSHVTSEVELCALNERGISNSMGQQALLQVLASNAGQVAVSPLPLVEQLATLDSDAIDLAVANTGRNQPKLDVAPIRAALLEHPAILDCLVLANLDRMGNQQIAAVFSKDDSVSATVSEIRRFMRGQLSDEFVPSIYVETDEFDYLESGLIDEQSVQNPFAEADDYVAPNTATEEVVKEVWQKTLGIDRVSITDNFFDLGGHSLLAVRVLAELKRKTGVRLEDVVVVVYTLEQTAAEIDRRASTETTDAKDEAKSMGITKRLMNAVTGRGSN